MQWSNITYKPAATLPCMNHATSPKIPLSSRTAGIPLTTTVLQLHLCAQIRLTSLTSCQDVKATSFTLSEGKTPSTHTSTQHVWLKDTCTCKG